MNEPYLEVTFRHGLPLAAYLRGRVRRINSLRRAERREVKYYVKHI